MALALVLATYAILRSTRAITQRLKENGAADNLGRPVQAPRLSSTRIGWVLLAGEADRLRTIYPI